MRGLLHNLVAHPLHGLLWWVGLYGWALAVHTWWAPQPDVRYFHVAYLNPADRGAGDSAVRWEGPVDRETINDWRRQISRQLGKPCITIMGWQEYEGPDGWLDPGGD